MHAYSDTSLTGGVDPGPILPADGFADTGGGAGGPVLECFLNTRLSMSVFWKENNQFVIKCYVSYIIFKARCQDNKTTRPYICQAHS